jgi:hypothetical protein
MPACFCRIRLVVLVALVAACGGGANKNGTTASTGTGGAKGSGGAATSMSNTSSTSASSSSGMGTGGTGGADGGIGATTITLPQFVHGAAYVDVSLYSTIPIVVGVGGMAPDSVDVNIEGTDIAATKDTNGWVANVAMTLSPGPHMVVATAKSGGNAVGTAKGSLVVGLGSVEFTTVAKDGSSRNGNVMHDVAGDALVYSWVSNPTGSKNQLFMNRLDGGMTRLLSTDVVINDPNDEPLTAYTALGANGALGVVYCTTMPSYTVKLRAVDAMGKELVPAVDLAAVGVGFDVQAAGADPNGFSAAWFQLAPSDGGQAPVEIRFARWDTTANKLVGPITLDMDGPPAVGGMDPNPQALEPSVDASIACNATVCLVSYVRDIYNTNTLLNEQRVLVAVVDLASGTLKGTPAPISSPLNPDPESSGNQLVALADGSFVLAYQESVLLPPPCMMPMYAMDTCCDPTAPTADAIGAVKFDATGKQVGQPKFIFSHEGTREYPRIAPHPDGYALFWEDQRTECNQGGGFIRMAANVASPDLLSLLDPYLEMPNSIALPPEAPSIAVAGTNFVASWSDNRHGQGLLDVKTEQYLETYWRK